MFCPLRILFWNSQVRLWTFLTNQDILPHSSPPFYFLKNWLFAGRWKDEYFWRAFPVPNLFSIAVKKPLETSVIRWILCCWTLLRWTNFGCECSTRAIVGTERKGSEKGRNWESWWEQTWFASVSWKVLTWSDISRWGVCPSFLISVTFSELNQFGLSDEQLKVLQLCWKFKNPGASQTVHLSKSSEC